jgi:hypothetical protein
MIVAAAFQQSISPHYLAPATAVVVVLVVQGMRHMCAYRPRGRPFGSAIVTTLLVAVCVTPVLGLGNRVFGLGYVPRTNNYVSHCCSQEGNLERAEIRDRLLATPGCDLVIVRYDETHEFLSEWVYNAADIDGAEVVWARDMGVVKNRPLIEYFADRNVWLLLADNEPPSLTPYAAANQPSIGSSGE